MILLDEHIVGNHKIEISELNTMRWLTKVNLGVPLQKRKDKQKPWNLVDLMCCRFFLFIVSCCFVTFHFCLLLFLLLFFLALCLYFFSCIFSCFSSSVWCFFLFSLLLYCFCRFRLFISLSKFLPNNLMLNNLISYDECC